MLDPYMMKGILSSPRIDLGGMPFVSQHLDIVLAVLAIHGECHIEGCGQVDPARLIADLVAGR